MDTSFKHLIGNNKRIIPVISLPTLEAALPLADALASTGLKVLEITLRTEHGLAAIATLRQQRPELIVGAGTVKNTAQLQQCIDAGAQFAVSPGIDRDMVETSLAQQVTMIPGTMTPSEMMLAENLGLKTVKLFPASQAGGADFIRSMASIFPCLEFFPTGGITEDSVNDYLELDNVVCAGGTWLTPSTLVKNQAWAKIHEIAQRC